MLFRKTRVSSVLDMDYSLNSDEENLEATLDSPEGS